MLDNYQTCQLLLATAAQFYEKHNVGRPEPFNLFSVLHKETDEVNLHSRFLHALLNYRQPRVEARENLKDFLEHVGIKGFSLSGVEVMRERHNIDILISNADKKAIVIENKIRAKDQDKQLWRYCKTLVDQHFLERNIYLLYLTLDGHNPSPNSIGELKKEKILNISYKDNCFLTWLKSCQKRAYDEPELRDSLAQYIRLVQKLTGSDGRGKYMKALKEICLKDNNHVLIHDLHAAMLEKGTELLNELWKGIDCELKAKFQQLPPMDPSNRGLNYQLHGAISIEVGTESGRFWFGVHCPRQEYDDKHDKLKRNLEKVSGGVSNEWYPWWRYSKPYFDLDNPKDFKLLSDKEKRQEYAKKTTIEIEEDLKSIWKVLGDMGLVS